MAHVGQKCCFGPVGLFRCFQSIVEHLLLFHVFSGFCIHIRKAGADGVDQMVRTILRMTHASKFDDLPRFFAIHVDHVSVGNDQIVL